MKHFLTIFWWIIFLTLIIFWLILIPKDNKLKKGVIEDSVKLLQTASSQKNKIISEVEIDGQPLLFFAKSHYIKIGMLGLSHLPSTLLVVFLFITILYRERKFKKLKKASNKTIST